MATVDLGLAVLSLADDLTQTVAAFTTGWQEQTSVDGGVRVMANGRRRVVNRAGSSRNLTWTMRLLSKVDVESVKSWQGRTVLIRDSQGRKEYGVYFGVAVVDYTARDVHDVTFQFQSVTVPEYV